MLKYIGAYNNLVPLYIYRLNVKSYYTQYPPIGNSLGFFFVATNWQGEPENLEPHKHTAIEWFALDRLPESLAPSAQQVIEHMLAQEGVHFTVCKTQ